MRNVLASAMEAELEDIFVNCQRGAELRMALIEMGHAQPPIPAVTESATYDVFFNDNIYQRRSRSIDIYFYWVRDRVRQGQFLVYWMAEEHNLEDYFYQAPPHHQPSSIAEYICSPHIGRQQVCMQHATY